MPKYHFRISNGEQFDDGEELPNDEAAWEQAVLTVRDIESNLHLDTANRWSIEVAREGTPIFQIDVTARRKGVSAS